MVGEKIWLSHKTLVFRFERTSLLIAVWRVGVWKNVNDSFCVFQVSMVVKWKYQKSRWWRFFFTIVSLTIQCYFKYIVSANWMVIYVKFATKSHFLIEETAQQSHLFCSWCWNWMLEKICEVWQLVPIFWASWVATTIFMSRRSLEKVWLYYMFP